ncbi:MAG: aldehyde dehydrogenase [Acidobacteria bacterium]|nr:MAG: aldehyde dehydrogenase [Acidobacteriota bacterium]PYR19081.1 MAG: aldehyde dehydrogenase [Acidobacteriota bacterium]PYR54344.1 MAG: aldehyde dehydrogenase [Acidobacteriota bacterium]
MPMRTATAKTTTFDNFIDGAWVPSASGDTFENRNPANTDDLVGDFQKSTAEDAAQAIDAARFAYERWRLVPAPRRAELLFRAAQLIADRKESLARDMTREMGKVLDETRGDVQEAIDMTFFMAGEGRRQYGQTVPSELRDKFAMSIRQPVGVSAIITPWNFPMAIPSWKIVPALVCGNTVVFKPATQTPLSALNFVRILEEAGIPRGVVNLVTGGGGEVGSALLVSDTVRVVSFTGSTDVGRTVAERAGPSFKKVHLEMGGKNVVMIMDDADLDLAVEGCLWGGFGTTGQRCTAASRVVVHESVYKTFLEEFVARARALRVGDGLDPKTEMGPSVSEGQLQTVIKYVDIGLKEGAKLACGGHALTTGPYARGFFHEPTIFADVAPSMRIAQEEIFGPVVSVIPCRSFEEAVAIGNGVQYGLSASIYTRDMNRAFSAMRDMDTGIFYVNAPTIGAEVHLPFGGTKATGNGHREAGTAALDVFSEWKSVYVDFSGRLQRAQIDTADL